MRIASAALDARKPSDARHDWLAHGIGCSRRTRTMNAMIEVLARLACSA
ncbi:Hypothetical protein A7982_07824 [Minicystis rosea]|nr:Hypothetical protein A7982_07824 [Minicystis rosea]